MGKLIDLTGHRFGRLVVVERVGRTKSGYILWLCQCDCGNTHTVESRNLNCGSVRSCGCLQYETQLSNRKDNTKHGLSNKEALYGTWKNMKRRCYSPNDKRAKFYSGKGVIVCDEWRNDYSAFRNWALANGYKEGLTIDRIDNNGNYCPENCRWATAKIQANNQSRNRLLTYNGETLTMSEWADKLGITYGTINHRVQRGWSMARIVSTPQRRHINGHYVV